MHKNHFDLTTKKQEKEFYFPVLSEKFGIVSSDLFLKKMKALTKKIQQKKLHY